MKDTSGWVSHLDRPLSTHCRPWGDTVEIFNKGGASLKHTPWASKPHRSTHPSRVGHTSTHLSTAWHACLPLWRTKSPYACKIAHTRVPTCTVELISAANPPVTGASWLMSKRPVLTTDWKRAGDESAQPAGPVPPKRYGGSGFTMNPHSLTEPIPTQCNEWWRRSLLTRRC